MGFLDSLGNLAMDLNWNHDRQELPGWYVRMVEDALDLLRADALTPKRMAKLADHDVDVLRMVSKNGRLPGYEKEIDAIRAIAKKAVLLELMDDD